MLFGSWRSALARTFGLNRTRKPHTHRNKPRIKQLSPLERLEDRLAPAATLFVDNPVDFIITTDQGAAGLDNGDVVTWDAGAGSEHSPSVVPGLIFGVNAFSTIQSAVNFATAGDTIRVAGGTFSEAVNVNKQLFVLGNQVGDDAQDGRVGDPESIVGLSPTG